MSKRGYQSGVTKALEKIHQYIVSLTSFENQDLNDFELALTRANKINIALDLALVVSLADKPASTPEFVTNNIAACVELNPLIRMEFLFDTEKQ